MNDTEYDIFVLGNDCSKDWIEFSSDMVQWRLREWQASLGSRHYVLRCITQTWDSDAWWLPLHDLALYPCELDPDVDPDFESTYESYVFISSPGVSDAIYGRGSSAFSLSAAHNAMRQVGAHVAMTNASFSDATSGGGLDLYGDRRHCASRAGDTGIISLPRDPAILIITAPAWKCILDQQIMKKNNSNVWPLISPHSLSVACSPGGALSACDIGQSCIFVPTIESVTPDH
jgi:hypothetical protein